jgi:hypothetical protein
MHGSIKCPSGGHQLGKERPGCSFINHYDEQCCSTWIIIYDCGGNYEFSYE